MTPWIRLFSRSLMVYAWFMCTGAWGAERVDLPRVLIIGDSISIGYTESVRTMLGDEAEVVHNPGNASHTWNGLEKLDAWLGRDRWDVIHFNWGLHDVKYMKDNRLDSTGQRVSTLDQYRENLEKLVGRLEATGAALIWASTTPIPDGAQGRKQGEEVEANAAAAEIMARRGVAVNDLHGRVLPELARFQRPRNVHFTPEGSEFLALHVGQSIRAALARRGSPVEAARGVIDRLLPGHAAWFVLEQIAPEDGKDVFEIESRDDKVILRGNNGVAICSALNWYLKYHCFCHVSWCGDQLDLPAMPPTVPEKIRRVSPHRYRYCLNYCAFSYSLAFWDWPRWERLIDWMALHGINLPLAVTGQEAVWQAVGRRFGLNDAQTRAFLPGPAYLPFGWMGCLDGWGGPLSQNWIDRHTTLQRRILARQRALGMTPLLQGFTGHVPVGLKEHRPQAKFQQLPKWCGFDGTTFVDPQDPLFSEFGRAFVEEQTRLFGTDHHYASDTFIEMSPPSSEPAFLADMGRSIYGAMQAADPQAVWVMQGWIFFNNPQFWQPPQTKALFGAVPDDRMVLIEMGGDSYIKTEGYYGKPWIWSIVHDFGGKVTLSAALPYVIEHFGAAMKYSKRGRLSGLGPIMEDLGYNAVLYDLLTDLMWRDEVPELEPWAMAYIHRRYGRELPAMREAWKRLLETAYAENHSHSDVVCLRPNLAGRRTKKARQQDRYDPRKLAEAGRLYLECADELGTVDTYRFDLVNVMRQILANLAQSDFEEIVAAYEARDRKRLTAAGRHLFDLVRDMDRLLGTRREFMLGPWLASAKAWATNDDEARLFEWNARNQITLWGPRDSVLHDYARKQWSGLMVSFHLPRWELFVRRLDEALAAEREFDADAFEAEVRLMEEQWTHAAETYPVVPAGDSVAVARELWDKHGSPALGNQPVWESGDR